MDLTTGAMCVSGAKNRRLRRAMWLRELWATRTWTTAVTGNRRRCMARFGIRGCTQGGLLIAKATGPGWSRWGGPGWMTRPGDSLLSTMAAGFVFMTAGDGFRDR